MSSSSANWGSPFKMGLHLAAIVSGAATLAGVAAVATARSSAAGWRSLPALALSYASATGFVIALAATPVAASRGSAALLGKREKDGSLPLWSLVAFAPFHFGLRAKLALQRARATTESNWDEVAPFTNGGGGGGGRGRVRGGGQGRESTRQRRRQREAGGGDVEGDARGPPALPYYLGGWPHEVNALPPGVSAVLDVTAELPRIAPAERFLNVRTWDTHGPSPRQIETAVRWVGEMRREGRRVISHCAHGHGRSVTVLAAALLAEREEEEEEEQESTCSSLSSSEQIDAVIAHIQKFRPRAKLNSRQRRALEGWLELKSAKKASVK